MTHAEHATKTLGQNPATPCASWHITFNGRCLNCGFDPCRDACPIDDPRNVRNASCYNCPKSKTETKEA